MSWRDLAQGLEVDSIYSINPGKYIDQDEIQDNQDKKDRSLHPTPSLHGVSLYDAERIAAEDGETTKDDPQSLECLAFIISVRRMRERGEIPPHYTSKTECQHCGMVPIFKGVPKKVLSCVWCFNRVGGKPMPSLDDSR